MAIEQSIWPRASYFTGEDKILSVAIYQSDDVTAQDITGWALSYMVKAARTDDDDDALITKTVGDGITITNGPAGLGEIALSDDDIEDIEGNVQYWHELKRMDAGLETVLLYGVFKLNQAVHRE